MTPRTALLLLGCALLVTVAGYAWNLDKRNRALVREYLARVEDEAEGMFV